MITSRMKSLAVAGLFLFAAIGLNLSVALAGGKVYTFAPGTQLKIAFVTNNTSDFWKIAQAGVKKFEKESGLQVTVRMPPTGTVEEQNRILEDLVSQGYNGIAVSVIAPADQTDVINNAAAKTNIITHDSDAADSNRLMYLGTNNYEAGRTLGKEIVKLLPNGGKIACFVGTFAADNASQRFKGIEDEVKSHNIEIVAKKEDFKDNAKAQSNVEDVIVSYPDISLLVGLWSYNGPAIASAIEKAGKTGKVLAAVFDEEDGTLDGISSGSIQCTVVQKPFEFGYQSAKYLAELATKGEAALPKDGLVDTGVTVINKANVEEFSKNLAAMKSGK
jgi:ribose transport system substrate-binding protein